MNKFPFIENNYHPEDLYLEELPNEDGFARFRDPDNGQWYFAFYHKGELVLRSEGYTTESGRDAGIKSVKANMDDDDNYIARMLPDGKWVLELRAGNNQEIARSPRYESEHEALAMRPTPIALRDAVHDTSMERLERRDDYLACREYDDRPMSDDFPGFTTFEKNGEFYFALVDRDGEIVLRGEGYKTAGARDQGIEAVMKNRSESGRYVIEEHLGYHFVILRAGNNKEIARSCPKTMAGAEALIAMMTAPVIPLETLEKATPLASFEEKSASPNWLLWAAGIIAVLLLYLWLTS